MLLASVQELSYLRELPDIMAVVRGWARKLAGADGVTFVLREKDQVFYADEEAIAPLWKGRRFPAEACISGWSILHREVAIIEDIYADARIPIDAYSPTFVKSLMMTPIRAEDPIGAIGVYWATRHRASDRERELIQALANATSVAIANAELYREAREAVRLRDEFLAIAAHELRTPIQTLQLSLEGALTTDEGEARRRRIERGVRSLGALTELVERMLDVSRFTSGQLAPTLAPDDVDLAAVAAEALERLVLAKVNGSAQARLEAPAPVVGRWDRVRLDQIVTNLLTNAMKYGENKPITVSVAVENGGAVLRVRDRGIGIAAADHARIFGAFERAVPATRYGGLGLGLYIARRLAESHGGTIALASAPGDGATFTVELPLR